MWDLFKKKALKEHTSNVLSDFEDDSSLDASNLLELLDDSMYEHHNEIDIPTLDLDNVDWDKKIVLIMDDNETIVFFIEQDFLVLQNLSEKLKSKTPLSISERRLINIIDDDNQLMNFLLDFNKDDYSLIKVTSEYAAFAIRNNIKRIKRVDFAILDILLGGSIQDDETRQRINLTGIDVAKDIIDTVKKDVNLAFYTGCDLGKYSYETVMFKELLPDKKDLRNYVIPKDMDIADRRVKVLKLLLGREVNDKVD